MSSHWQRPGIGHVGEYQSAGHAYYVPASATDRIVSLEYVPRAITFLNSDSSNTGVVKFHDGDTGTQISITIPKSGVVRFEIKCKKFEIAGDSISAVVELTNIPISEYLIMRQSVLATIQNA